MAVGLQWQPTALATRLANAKRVCINLPTTTGIGAAQHGKLRATARLINHLSGQNQRRKRTQGWIKHGGKVSSDGGGRTWATIATLLQTAKMNNVDPQAWLTQTLERIVNGWPSSDLDALMPWNYAG